MKEKTHTYYIHVQYTCTMVTKYVQCSKSENKNSEYRTEKKHLGQQWSTKYMLTSISEVKQHSKLNTPITLVANLQFNTKM